MNNKVCSGKDRIRPAVIVLVAAAMLAFAVVPFVIIRAVWSGKKPASTGVLVKLIDPASNEEYVVGIPDGVSGLKMSASNGSLLVEFRTADPAESLTIEIEQGHVLCRSDGGEKAVQGRSLRLTRDGKTLMQGRDGKLTLTSEESSTTIQAIGDQIYNLDDGKDSGVVVSGHSVEFTFLQTPASGDGLPQTRPAAPRSQPNPPYWKAVKISN